MAQVEVERLTDTADAKISFARPPSSTLEHLGEPFEDHAHIYECSSYCN